MATNVQIRNVPQPLVDELKARAAARRLTLSDYLLGQLEEIASTPSLDEWLDRHTGGPPRELGVSALELLDEVRAEE